MDDIGKVLHDRIKADFEKRIEADRSIAAIMKKIGSGKADLNDTAKYSVRLGELIKASILDCILPSDLPQEKMYYNIAKSILEPLLHDNYDRINAVCADVQRSLDKKIGINLKPFEVDYPDERIRSALNGVVAKETAVESVDVLGRTAKNITASANDDFVEKNAEYRSKAGLDVFIERKDDGKCCEWCSKLAGRYRYPDQVPRDVFKRHDNCGCLVSYVTPGGMRQNVHSKRWVNEQAKAKRIEYAADDSVMHRAVKRSDFPAHISRNDQTLTVRRVTTAVNNIYISDNVQIKPKQFHEIDKKLTEVYKLMGISSSDNKPTVYILSNNEMSSSKIIAASYRGHDNALFINKDHVLYSADTAAEEMKAFACYTDDRSTLVHELFHWKDAEEYRQKFGAIDPDDPSAYNKYVDEMCRKRLDKVLKKGYNINEISPYALDRFMYRDYAETYTEYRTQRLLKGG